MKRIIIITIALGMAIAAGAQADSICADPLFVNAEDHDYRLREDSPAHRLGIHSIDTSTIGLCEDYRY